jgi:hypothetical protein
MGYDRSEQNTDHIAQTLEQLKVQGSNMKQGFDKMRNLVHDVDQRHTYRNNSTNQIVSVQGLELIQQREQLNRQRQQINVLATAERMRLGKRRRITECTGLLMINLSYSFPSYSCC